MKVELLSYESALFNFVKGKCSRGKGDRGRCNWDLRSRILRRQEREGSEKKRGILKACDIVIDESCMYLVRCVPWLQQDASAAQVFVRQHAGATQASQGR